MCYTISHELTGDEHAEAIQQQYTKMFLVLPGYGYATTWAWHSRSGNSGVSEEYLPTEGNLDYVLPRLILVPNIWFGGIHPSDRPGYCVLKPGGMGLSGVSLPGQKSGGEWAQLDVAIRGRVWVANDELRPMLVAEQIKILKSD